MKGISIIGLGIVFLVLGFLLITAGILFSIAKGSFAQKEGRSEVKGGGVILIGPIPIVLGTDIDSAKIVLVLALILTLLAFFLFWRW
ncbi:MAG: DUF131 domain-containing protein [Candidatus Hydrothermarchaeota archaeon]